FPETSAFPFPLLVGLAPNARQTAWCGGVPVCASCGLVEALLSQRLEALVNRQVLLELDPLARVAHKGQIKPPVTHIFEPGEPRFKKRRERRWARASVLGAEIEVAAKPRAVEFDNVIELVPRRRW